MMAKLYTLPDQRILREGQAFTLNDIAYAGNWLQLASPEDLAAAGITVSQEPPPPPPPPPKAETITMFQCREQLARAGLLDTVNATMVATGGTALRAWEYSTTVHRSSPLVAAMATQLNLTAAQIDQLFLDASAITV